MQVMQKTKIILILWLGVFRWEQMYPSTLRGISIWFKHLGLNNPSNAPHDGDILWKMSQASRLIEARLHIPARQQRQRTRQRTRQK